MDASFLIAPYEIILHLKINGGLWSNCGVFAACADSGLNQRQESVWNGSMCISFLIS